MKIPLLLFIPLLAACGPYVRLANGDALEASSERATRPCEGADPGSCGFLHLVHATPDCTKVAYVLDGGPASFTRNKGTPFDPGPVFKLRVTAGSHRVDWSLTCGGRDVSATTELTLRDGVETVVVVVGDRDRVATALVAERPR